jgi:hypothetical protein
MPQKFLGEFENLLARRFSRKKQKSKRKTKKHHSN